MLLMYTINSLAKGQLRSAKPRLPFQHFEFIFALCLTTFGCTRKTLMSLTSFLFSTFFSPNIYLFEGSIWYFCVHSYFVLATVNEVSRLFYIVRWDMHNISSQDYVLIFFFFLHCSMFWAIWKVNMFSTTVTLSYPKVIIIHYFFPLVWL